MRILHFIPSLIRGGAERVLIDLANAAAHRGHQVAIVAAVRNSPELMPTALRSDVELRYVHPRGGVRAAQVRLVPWTIANRKWLLSHDVVHCHLWLGTEFGAFLQRIRGRRQTPAIVETYHAVGMQIPKFHRALHAFFLGGRDAIAFMAEDPYWGQYRAARPGQLFRTIPNGVSVSQPRDSGAHACAAQWAGIPGNALVIGSIGRLVDERRPDLLMEVFEEIAGKIEGAHLLLGGDGPERPTLEARARDAGLEQRLHLPGLVLDAVGPFSIIDLYLTVAVGPTVGIAALEAALFGLPVLAVQLLPDYRPAPEDWIWSSVNPAHVAARAVELLRDPAVLHSLAERQHAHARKHYSAESMGKAYDQLYADALARRRERLGS
jgi:glycosyltransferase involved in cell wall biosynthesis